MKRKQAKPTPGEQWKQSFERITQMKRVMLGFRSLLDEELQPLGITTAQLRLLRAVQDEPGSSGARLAGICSVTAQTGQQVMVRLEANGWIKREKDPANERVLLATLTKRGETLLVQARKRAQALDRKLWRGIAREKLEGLDGALAEVGDKVEEMVAGRK